MEQNTYNNTSAIQDARNEPSVAWNETRMPLVIVLDISDSLNYLCLIDLLNQGIKAFKDGVLQDPKTKDILEVCVIAFNHEAHLEQDWVPIEGMNCPSLTAAGGTAFVPALRMALDKLDERVRFLKSVIGPNFYKPWIVMITDGKNEHGPSVDTIAPEIRALDKAGKLRLWALGVDGYDAQDLHKLTDRVLSLRDHDFTEFFNWLTKSLRAVSVTAPGETPQLPDLPENVDKDVSGWA